MILPLREIDVMGVLIAPFALCIPIGIATAFVLLTGLRRLPAARGWARSPAVEFSLLVATLSGFVLLLGRI